TSARASSWNCPRSGTRNSPTISAGSLVTGASTLVTTPRLPYTARRRSRARYCHAITPCLPRSPAFGANRVGRPKGARKFGEPRRAFGEFLRGLGVSGDRAPSKRVPEAIFEAPEEAAIAFLQGLFDADGCVVRRASNETRYVGLGSRSEELLIEVQELLASL